MPRGQCLCGEVQVSFTGEPALQALCHCTDCRRVSGSAFSTNLFISHANFTLVSGTPKLFEKTGEESGLPIKSFLCGNCGTTCYREGDAFPGVKIIKAGILHGFEVKPTLEGYADRRAPWVPEVKGATQIASPKENNFL